MAGWFENSFFRFLFAGAANTLGTLAIYFLLIEALPSSIAWAIAFAIGIVFTNVVYPRFVFRVQSTVIGATGNTIFYLVSFLVSEALLSAATHWLDFGPRIAGVIVAAVMVPVNFLVARYFFTQPTRSAPSSTNASKEP